MPKIIRFSTYIELKTNRKKCRLEKGKVGGRVMRKSDHFDHTVGLRALTSLLLRNFPGCNQEPQYEKLPITSLKRTLVLFFLGFPSSVFACPLQRLLMTRKYCRPLILQRLRVVSGLNHHSFHVA